MKNKLFFTLLILIILLTTISGNLINSVTISRALQDGQIGESYIIYDENNNYIFEKSGVEIGDNYISTDYKKYEVVYLNQETKVGIARFIEQVIKPKIKISDAPAPIAQEKRTIGLYSTHNDESYLPTDGYYTVYGKGGIHDVGNRLKTSLENLGITVIYNETLHLPHNSSAYSRSNVTAKELLSGNNLDALFDIHRDGIPRSYYATNVNGQEKSKIRIVVGKSNSKMKNNEELAIYLRAVADELYPWLISDIYYASGHYNQGLFEKALLFEMGTYLIEKELVYQSVTPLAHVISVTLFNTTVNSETGELEIGGQTSFDTTLINDLFNQENNKVSLTSVIIYGSIAVMILCVIVAITIFIYYYAKSKKSTKSKNRKK